ncbi:MAG TPA: tetratricopeptide repeat protein [Gammaproteobacteria bacterium]|nr:tetratricopeptide repeat protein [Gammaproteobacteria bacterium]
MKRCLPILLTITYVSAGCSIFRGDDAPTIADLGHRPVRLDDVPIESTEQQAMNAYRRFLETSDRSEARPQAMRRLADINLESDVLPEAETTEPELVAQYPQQVQDSILLYQQVLENYPDRPDNDSVLYQLARAYEMGGEPDKSLVKLNQLVRQYPDSNHRLESQFRMGEILFIKKDYRGSELAYQAVVDSGDDNPFFQQSLYKLGWCYFKQGLFTEGLDAFTDLLDRKLAKNLDDNDRLAGLERAEREMVEDTLRVMSLSFSYEEGARSVAAYYAEHGTRHYEDVVYDHLGKLYLDKERYTDAADTFGAFVSNNPIHRQAPAFQMRVIDAYQAGKFPSLVLQGKKDFVDRYNLQGEYWQHHDTAEAGQVLGFLKVTMTDLSRHYHAQAQKSRKQEDYAEATHWYRTWLGSFANDPEAAGMNFLLAELLDESGSYREASMEFVRTAYDYGDHEKAAEAGYASVLAYGEEETRLSGADQAAWHRESIENALRFAASFPRHPQSLAVLTRSAEQLLAINENTRAIQVAQLVIDNASATRDQQRVSWTVQAHAYFDLQDFLHAEHAYQQVLARTAANDKDINQLTERLAASIYKQGEAAQAVGETRAAVGHFQRVRNAAPSASIVATAEYDAAAGLLRLNDFGAAASTLEQFRSTYPDDPRQEEVTRRLATAYLASARPLQAAQEFERIGRSDADAQLRSDALWQAAELFARAGRSDQSTAIYVYYIQQFPQPVATAIEARQHVADQYKSLGDVRQWHQWLQEIITADAQAGNNRTDRTRYLAAHARLTLADAQNAQYQAVALKLPLNKTLASKKRLLEATLAQYEQAAAYDVAIVTTAAAYHTAQLYMHLGRSLMESERPKNLNAEALEEYSILLEDQAYPFEEQAIALHETNAARIESGMFDAWIEKSLHELARLVPGKYAKQERSTDYVASLR